MEFVFNYKVRPSNLMVLGLTNIYRSMAGFVNTIFTLSMVLVAYRFWPEAGAEIKLLIGTGILLFPVFQPVFIYLRGRRIVSQMPVNLEMAIDGNGISVRSDKSSSLIGFSELKSVVRVRGILIIYTRSKQSFILNKETLNGKEEELYSFLMERTGSTK